MLETAYGEQWGIAAHGTDTILLCCDADNDATSVTLNLADLRKLSEIIVARVKVLEQ